VSENLDVAAVEAQLRKLKLSVALQRRRSSPYFVQIEGGPSVSLLWGDGRREIRVLFPAGHTYHRALSDAQVVSTGKSPWVKDRTWKLSADTISKLAKAIAGNPTGRVVTKESP
jgi:hypothetical protein